MSNYIKRKYSYPIFFIINVVMATIRLSVFPNESHGYHFSVFIAALLLFILGWEALIKIHGILENFIPLEKQPFLKISLQIFLSATINTLLSFGLFYIANLIFSARIVPMWDSVVYLMNFFIALIFNLGIFGAYYFVQWKKDLIHKSSLEKESLAVKYDALRNQLNPHFLFNALTSLNSLIFENQQLASEFLQQLAKVYRYTLQHRLSETVSLETEMEFIRHFISLLKTRFGDAIVIKMEVREDDLDLGMVPVLSQILMENAVKHNSISLEKPLAITLSSDGEYFIVANNKIKKSQLESSNKIGMENLKDLYQYLSKKTIIVEDNDNTFVVKVPLIK